MTRIQLFLTLAISLIVLENVKSQNVNGQAFSFPAGKTEWSDTIYKKLRTKKMAKDGMAPVLLAIRYKVIKQEKRELWYDLEITNKSPDTKVKFKVAMNHNQDAFTVKLGPNQTRVIEKLNWVIRMKDSTGEEDNDWDNLFNPYEEIMQNRY
jgi:hypothetical protein